MAETYGRGPWVVDRAAAAWAQGTSVAVLGAGGGLGSEVCRRLAHARARHLLLVDTNRAALTAIDRELETVRHYRHRFALLANLIEVSVVARAMRTHQPDTVVFAAGVHDSSLADAGIYDVLHNNVIAPLTAGEAAARAGASRFILLSGADDCTPSGALACSYLLGEFAVEQLASRSSMTCVIVRVGQTFGERGGLVEHLQTQLDAGGPLIVDHQDEARRLLSEQFAIQLALSAAGSPRTAMFSVDAGETIDPRRAGPPRDHAPRAAA